MITRAEKLRLGVFLIVSGIVVVATIVLLTGLHLTRSLDEYTVAFGESVSGLEVGAQVKYNGVRVGQITDIEIDRGDLDRVIATLALREGTPIMDDTNAILVAMGITGLKFVELTGGSKKAKLLEPGAEIPAGQSFIGSLEGKAQDIAVKTELALNKINYLLSTKNVHRVGTIIENVGDITGGVSTYLKKNDEKLERILANLDSTAKELNAGMGSANKAVQRVESMMTSAEPQVDRILVNVHETTTSFNKAAKSLQRVDKILKEIGDTLSKFNDQIKDVNVKKITGDAEKMVGQAESMVRSLRRLVESSRGDIHQSAKSLSHTLRNLEVLSSELRDQPSLLINSKPPKERTPEEK